MLAKQSFEKQLEKELEKEELEKEEEHVQWDFIKLGVKCYYSFVLLYFVMMSLLNIVMQPLLKNDHFSQSTEQWLEVICRHWHLPI